MSTFYSDNPNANGNGSTGYRDNPPLDPDGLYARDPPTEVFDAAALIAPPTDSFPKGIVGDNSNDDDDEEDMAETFELVQTPYRDDPNSQYTDEPLDDDDENEPYGEDDIRYRQNNDGNTRYRPSYFNLDPATKKSAVIGFLGFAIGIIVMFAFLSMSKGDRTGVRGSSDIPDGLSLDPTGENDYGMQGEGVRDGDAGEFQVYVDQNQESSSESPHTIKDWTNSELAKQENVEDLSKGNANEASSNNGGKESEESNVPTQSQEPTTPVNGVNNNQSNQANNAAQTQGQSNEAGKPAAPTENAVEGPFCGTCMWKGTAIHCNTRVEYLMSKHGMTKEGAQTGLLNQGHCSLKSHDVVPGATQGQPAGGSTNKMAGVPTTDQCRKHYKPGQVTIDNFCSNCMWKSSNMNCYKRIEFLVSTYSTPATEAMTKEMERGNCMENKTEAEWAKLKKQGLERWCGACMFRSLSCWKRVTNTGQLNEDDPKVIAAKMDLLNNNHCMMPEYCDGEEETGNTDSVTPAQSPPGWRD